MSTSTSNPSVAESAAYPVLSSPRFRFRPFEYSDIERLSALASQHRIADSTVGIPHPYTTEFARMWIASHPVLWADYRALHWAALKIDDIDSRHILGYVGLSKIDIERKQAELRFWVGCGAQRKEYATEWCEAVLQFASASLDMARVYALQIARHPLAGRVLAGLGMHPEGYVRKRVHKEGLIEDIVCWGLTSAPARSCSPDAPIPRGDLQVMPSGAALAAR
jgi:RimJ/RimL family protein N-acetyltransferase